MAERSGMSSIIGVYFAASLGAYGDQKELLRRATIEASFSGSLNGSRVIGGGRGRDGTPLAPGSSPGSADMSGGTLVLSSDLTGISWLSSDLPESSDWTVTFAGASVPEALGFDFGRAGRLGAAVPPPG